MGLDRARLRDRIREVFAKGFEQDSTPEEAFVILADELSMAIDDYVRNAEVVDVKSDVSADLTSSVNLTVEGEVFEGVPVSGKGFTATGPIVIVGETVEKGKVLGRAKGKQTSQMRGECKQKGTGRLQ